MRVWISGLGLISALAAALVMAQESPRPAAKAGEQVFMTQGCYGCHLVGRVGTPIGPDLTRIGTRYREADLARWLGDPASQKPTAHMPRIVLSPTEITQLAAFLAAQR
jgi:cbb3-type cytochrome oxidase cytochrome c subunit